jgi:acetyl esterase/lipase
VAPYAFLALALTAAALTLNAHLPIRRSATLLFPSFVAGWIASELAVQLLVLQVGITALFVRYDALASWPGWLALALTVLSWLGMLGLALAGRRSAGVLTSSLQEGLGAIGIEPAAVLAAPHRLLAPLSRGDREVEGHFNLRYAEGAGARHLLDVYTSRTPRTKAPVLLQIHGGGWFTGDKRQQALPLILHAVRCGFVCVSANYRLSPKATFPEHLEDVKLALSWVRTHIAEYGGDPNWVAITGGSAGGHLCALAALSPNDPEYQKGFEHVDTSVRACVPLYGVYDLTDRNKHQRHDGMHRLVSRWVLKKKLESDRDAFERASPMSRVGEHAPPFFVIHGSHDNMAPVADAHAFVGLLKAVSRQPVVYAELPGAHHAFEIFHSVRTANVVRAIVSFLSAIHARDVARAASEVRASSPEAQAVL